LGGKSKDLKYINQAVKKLNERDQLRCLESKKLKCSTGRWQRSNWAKLEINQVILAGTFSLSGKHNLCKKIGKSS
jgi:hypothetical protein